MSCEKKETNKDAVKLISRRQFFSFAANQSGATAVEYGLIAAATGLSIVVGMRRTKRKLKRRFRKVGRKLK